MSDDYRCRRQGFADFVNGLFWGVGIAAVVILLGLIARSCSAAEAYEVGASYANRPAWQALTGFDEVLLSPRAYREADSLRARGVRVRLWVQSVYAPHWRHRPWDRDLGALVDRLDGVARYPDGDTAWVTMVDDPLMRDVALLDLGRPEVAAAWADLLNRYGDRWLLDDGCGNPQWLFDSYTTDRHDPPMPTAYWPLFLAGSRHARRLLADDYCQCDKRDTLCAGIVVEKIGQTLNPMPKVWALARQQPAILLLSRSDAQARRATAAIALLTDAGMNWGWATPTPNREIPELDGRAGSSYIFAPPYERAPGVWMRRLSHSFVLLNLSPAPFVFSRWTVAPGDGLVVLIRDAESGRYMAWRVP